MADRRTFWPVALLGTAFAALTAVAAGQGWGTAEVSVVQGAREVEATGTDVAPLALALALVALAAWGTILVLRGRARRVAAAAGLLASLGVLVIMVVSYGSISDVARRVAGDVPGADTSLGAWYLVGVVAAAVSVGALAIAVVRAPQWPEMGSRYDAPGSREREPDQADLWKAIDDGRDPTL